MKKTSQLLILITITLNLYSQVEYTCSFIDINIENQLNHIFGSSCMSLLKKNSVAYTASDSLLIQYNYDPISGELLGAKSYYDGISNKFGTNCNRHIIVDNDERYLFLSSTCPNGISVFSIDSPSGDCKYIETIKNNTSGLAEFDSPGDLTISTDDKFLYVSSSFRNKILTFSINPSKGNLSFVDSIVDPISERRNFIRVTPDNRYIYSVPLYDSSFTIFERNMIDGKLSFKKMVSHGFHFSSITDIEFDKESNLIYILSDGTSSLHVYKPVNSFDSIIHVQSFTEGKDNVFGISNPKDIAISEDNRIMYVLNHKVAQRISIAVFMKINNVVKYIGTEDYLRTEKKTGLGYPTSINCTADSRYVFITDMSNANCKIFEAGLFRNIGEETTFCEGDSVMINTKSCFDSCKWSINSNDSIVYLKQDATIKLLREAGSETVIIDTIQIKTKRCNITTNKEIAGNSKQLKVYPNPVKDQLNIFLSELVVNGIISIVNMHGKVVLEKLVTSGENLLNIEHLPQGSYFVRYRNYSGDQFLIKNIVK